MSALSKMSELTFYRRMAGVAAIIILICLGLNASADSPMAGDAGTTAENNKKVVLDFYQAGLVEKDFAKASKYFGPTYIQHNPFTADGTSGFASLLEILKSKYPDLHVDIKQVFADGNFVILHDLQKLHPSDRGTAVVDIFRLENGKIVERWDVAQEIPAELANRNGMF